jgi:hypothetical protein
VGRQGIGFPDCEISAATAALSRVAIAPGLP